MYTINVVSNEGHTIYEEATAEAAVETAKKVAKEDNKWIYVGAQYTSPDALSVGMLEGHDTITLTNPLVGGNLLD